LIKTAVTAQYFACGEGITPSRGLITNPINAITPKTTQIAISRVLMKTHPRVFKRWLICEYGTRIEQYRCIPDEVKKKSP